MKITDNPHAKYELWAKHPRNRGAQFTPVNLPKLGSRKFNSYEEFNEWKQSVRLQIARNGGLKWKKS
jgi:hypothetical protein